MKTTFTLPNTVRCNVIYMNGNVMQSANIATPKSTDGVITEMLKRKVGTSQIVRVDPVIPHFKPQQSTHPAARQVAKYSALATA